MGGWSMIHEGNGKGLESVRKAQTRVGGYRQSIRIMEYVGEMGDLAIHTYLV